MHYVSLLGIVAPEIVVRNDLPSTTGTLYPVNDALLTPLQLDQGAFLEIHAAGCPTPVAVIASGRLGARGRLGVAAHPAC